MYSTEGREWETYAGQSGEGFTLFGYRPRNKDEIVEEIKNLYAQIAEVYRRFGKDTQITLYK